MSKVTGETISGKIQEIMVDKTAEKSTEVTVKEMIVMIEVGIGLGKDNFPEIMIIIELGVKQ